MRKFMFRIVPFRLVFMEAVDCVSRRLSGLGIV